MRIQRAAKPASAAEMVNAMSLYRVTLTPTDSAAMRLSRMDIIARPVRELMRFRTMKSVMRISTKPSRRWRFAACR